MRRAVDLAGHGSARGDGGPFGAVVVREGEVIAEAWNEVVVRNDPTAHAEMLALQRAGAALHRSRLNDCEVFASCEPCPMCLAALRWAEVARVVYAATREDAAAVGFADAELHRPASPDWLVQEPDPLAPELMRAWLAGDGEHYGPRAPS